LPRSGIPGCTIFYWFSTAQAVRVARGSFAGEVIGIVSEICLLSYCSR
jgi:hypothetical protein